jgi:cytochrome c
MVVNRGILASAIVSVVVAAGPAEAAASALSDGDAAHGKALYQGCLGCHSIHENALGPKHRGLVGRRAGSVQD